MKDDKETRRALAAQGRAGRADGQLFRATAEDLEPGSVLRMVNGDGTAAPFSDFVVVARYAVDSAGFRVWDRDDPSRARARRVELARPFLYATLTGTVCASHMTGVEEITVDEESLLKEDSLFRVVCTARGALHSYVK